jgi:hypothetical protein
MELVAPSCVARRDGRVNALSVVRRPWVTKGILITPVIVGAEAARVVTEEAVRRIERSELSALSGIGDAA